MREFLKSAMRGLLAFVRRDREVSQRVDETKAILLDMDGVVNNNRNMFITGVTPYGGKCQPEHLDIVSVGLVNKIKRLTGARLILMSTWAVNCNEERLRVLSRMTGLSFDGFVSDEIGDQVWLSRGECVIEWLKANPKVKDFVVIDDEIDHHHKSYASRVIPIDPDVGITTHHLPSIGECLGVDIWQLAIEEKNAQYRDRAVD